MNTRLTKNCNRLSIVICLKNLLQRKLIQLLAVFSMFLLLSQILHERVVTEWQHNQDTTDMSEFYLIKERQYCKNNIGSPGKQGPSRNQLYIVCNF